MGDRPGSGRQLTWLLLPIFTLMVVQTGGTALAPTLLGREPLLLIALNPVYRHLILASGSLDLLPFFAVATLRLFVADPFYFALGRLYGDDTIVWLERRMGGAGRMVRWVERCFERAAVPVLFVLPAGLICALAGASGMRARTFVLVDLAGTVTAVAVIRLFGVALNGPLEEARGFIAAHVGVLTGASVLAVGAMSLWRWRCRRRLPPMEGVDEVLVPQDDDAHAE